ncbi:DUF3054 domain-containing protein [Janibacter massiliensis]|uniref:DUF3054 domain-containing protein n=1 Tax=Janibacter massiliensis TaxID=2058291 RepID=UPI000D0F803B|nr:DUF3054 domain-containing protein [Janibacter massiliensis]
MSTPGPDPRFGGSLEDLPPDADDLGPRWTTGSWSFTWGRSQTLALVLDVLLVVVFAVVGRSSHAEGIDAAGVLTTAWPFLVGLGLGWLLVLGTLGRWPAAAWHGVPVWLSTVFGGMAVRQAVGQGTALPFVVVATLVAGAFLLGWRAIASLARLARRRAAG